jgi:hypothetical protein
VVANPIRVNASDPALMVITAEGIPVALFWDEADAAWYVQTINDAADDEP